MKRGTTATAAAKGLEAELAKASMGGNGEVPPQAGDTPGIGVLGDAPALPLATLIGTETAPGAESVMVLPGLAALTRGLRLKRVYHIVRTVNEWGQGWEQQVVSFNDANKRISELLAEGWLPVHLQALGVAPDGIQMLWVLGEFENMDGVPHFSEVKHISRTLGSMAASRGITGLQADALISSYLMEGFNLGYVTALGMGPEGVFMYWVLLR